MKSSLVGIFAHGEVAKQLPGLRLPNTLMFDYPTVSAISDYAVGPLAGLIPNVHQSVS